MIFAVRTYVNYLAVVDSIETVDARTAAVQNEMDYAENFQKKYLASDYGYLSEKIFGIRLWVSFPSTW